MTTPTPAPFHADPDVGSGDPCPHCGRHAAVVLRTCANCWSRVDLSERILAPPGHLPGNLPPR